MDSNHQKCVCEIITQIGFWEGVDANGCATGGPTVKCKDCGTEFKLSWEKWKAIPDDNKTALV